MLLFCVPSPSGRVKPLLQCLGATTCVAPCIDAWIMELLQAKEGGRLPDMYDKEGKLVPTHDAKGRKNANYTRLLHAERVKQEAASMVTHLCVCSLTVTCFVYVACPCLLAVGVIVIRES